MAITHSASHCDGSLFAWGFNFKGQLGVGDTEERRVPTLVTALQGKQVAHAAAGQFHTICTTADGSVFTWGNGNYGKLGLGNDWSNKLVPTQVRGELENKPVLQVASGDEHSACVAEDGAVYTWGRNIEGQLGVADVGRRTSVGTAGADVPVLVQTLDTNSIA